MTQFRLAKFDFGNQKPGMLCGYADGLQVVVHNAEPPSLEEWNSYTRSIAAEGAYIQTALVFTIGGGPNAMQRKQAQEAWSKHAPNTLFAVLTTSVVVRGIVTALNYFFDNKLKAFHPSKVGDALKYLKTPVTEAQVRGWVGQMAGDLGFKANFD